MSQSIDFSEGSVNMEGSTDFDGESGAGPTGVSFLGESSGSSGSRKGRHDWNVDGP